MASAAAQARLLSLTMHRSDLQFKLMSISQSRQALTTQAMQIAQAYSDAGIEEGYEDDIEVIKINKAEQLLEQQQQMVQTELTEINAEYDSIEKLVGENIKRDFKLNFGS